MGRRLRSLKPLTPILLPFSLQPLGGVCSHFAWCGRKRSFIVVPHCDDKLIYHSPACQHMCPFYWPLGMQ